MKKKISFLLAMLMIALLALSACGGGNAQTSTAPTQDTSATSSVGGADASQVQTSEEVDGSYAYIKEKGSFIVGMDDSFPPMGFREDGEIVGYDVDLAKGVAEHLGLEVVFQPIDWKAKDMELNTKNIDVIWNGFSINEERQQNFLLSEPYLENAQIVVVLQDSDIQTLEDLKGKKVAVQDGSSAQDALKESGDLIDNIEQLDFKDNVTALMDLSVKQVDAVAVDLVVANYYLAKEPGKYRILDEHLAPEQYAIGFRKGEQAFCDAVEGALAEMEEDGTMAEIKTKWFGEA